MASLFVRRVAARSMVPVAPVRAFSMTSGAWAKPMPGPAGTTGPTQISPVHDALNTSKDHTIPHSHYARPSAHGPDYSNGPSALEKAGQLFLFRQGHTTFDVVAWSGK